MHAAQIQFRFDFIQKYLFPGLPFGRLGPVRHFIAADDYHLGMGPLTQ